MRESREHHGARRIARALAMAACLLSLRAHATSVDQLLLKEEFTAALAQADADVAKVEKRGAGHETELAGALEERAWVMFVRGDFASDTLKTSAERALALRAADAKHPATQIKPLALLARGAVTRGQKDQARQLIERALAIADERPRDRALLLAVHADLEVQTGDYAGAQRDLGGATEIYARRASANPILQSRSLVLTSYLLGRNGDWNGARAAAQAAMKAVERTPGAGSLAYAGALSQLGVVEDNAGEFAAARQHMEAAVASNRARPAGDRQDFGRLLSNLGNVCLESGDLQAARRYYGEAIDDAKTKPGSNQANVATRFTSLAGVGLELGDLPAAKAGFEAALALATKALGAEHERLARMHQGLAYTLLLMGDADGASHHCQRTYDLRRQAFGADSPMTADGLVCQGAVHLRAGRFADARTQFEHALALSEKLGADSVNTLTARLGLAQSMWGLGDVQAAFANAAHAERTRLTELQRNAPSLSEREAIAFAQGEKSALPLLFALAQNLDTDDARATAWSAGMAERGLVTQTIVWRIAHARAQHDPALRSAWDLWRSASAHYATLAVDAARAPSAKATAELEAAQAGVDRAEHALAERVLAAQSVARISADEVAPLRTALDRDDALLAFFSVEQRSARDPFVDGPHLPRTLYAFSLTADGRSRLTPLGDAATVTAAVAHWYNDVRDAQTPAEVVQRSGTALRERIWDPVRAGLAAKHVYIVPDAALFRVNWAALPDGDRYLVETGPQFHQLDHERELLQKPAADPFGRSLLIAGAPDFDLASVKVPASAGAAPVVALERSICGAGDFRFAPLPGTEREAKFVAAEWAQRSTGDHSVASPRLLLGAKASKQALAAQAPQMDNLHFATHGFALGERCTASSETQRGFDLAPATVAQPADGSTTSTRELVGLALAGANRPASDAEHDGLLTSEDIAALDLHNARWVVLSACDSGLGQIIEGEGVFGLRRAFRLAGAHSVIMSLWPVADQATADWMAHLYQARFQQGLGTADALHSATLAALNARRAAGLSTQPYYWASFIAAGDWR